MAEHNEVEITLETLQRSAKALERIADALEKALQPNEDAELSQMRIDNPWPQIACRINDGTDKLFPAQYIRQDDKIILQPHSHANYYFEKFGEVWFANYREIDA